MKGHVIMAQDPLAAWQRRLYYVLMGLTDLDMKGTPIAFDYSRASLKDLESELLARFTSPAAMRRPAASETLDGLVAYIGETLMRVAGGRWTWGHVKSEGLGVKSGPVANADAALGLAPVAPHELLAEVVSVRSGDRLTRTFDRWAGAVETQRAAAQSWRPDKQRTVADGPELDRAGLETWLSTQESRFPEWVAAYGANSAWDFRPETLPALETMLRQMLSSKEELLSPENERIREGAMWYLGETFRLNLGGHWTKNVGASPRVEGMGPRHGARITPSVALRAVVQKRGSLSERFAIAKNL
ncbi:hypothetical protein K1T35_06720 [Pseudonocardia sp. DSM 110487]|uniref:hypothetical protein n=1 Tax=Pseudonocardia sp. DSM 110487 TaxID=2865833 RepID=UPI001C699DDD|nr:hypothetical protein [Pseudonocardia sp. DSM 110487]QYN36950.1 hypothetical protein K1T35_06720 [Pseudonocardia sp. DSM 110487]